MSLAKQILGVVQSAPGKFMCLESCDKRKAAVPSMYHVSLQPPSDAFYVLSVCNKAGGWSRLATEVCSAWGKKSSQNILSPHLL